MDKNRITTDVQEVIPLECFEVDALYNYLNMKRIEHSSICKLIELYTKKLNSIEAEFGKVNSSFSLPVDVREVMSWTRDMTSKDYGTARANARKYQTLLSLAISKKTILEDEMDLFASEIPKAYEQQEAQLLSTEDIYRLINEEDKYKDEIGV